MAIKKKTAAKKTSRAPVVATGIPAGFTLPASAQVPNWDFEKQKTLQGEVVSIKTINIKKPMKGQEPTTQLMTVRDDKDNLLGVWKSGWLNGLFSEVVPGSVVFIRYDGLGPKIKGRNQAKMFTSAIQDGSPRNDGAKPAKKATKKPARK